MFHPSVVCCFAPCIQEYGRRWVVFQMFEIIYAQSNPKLPGGWDLWRMLVSGFLGVWRAQFVGRFVRCLLICARRLGISDVRWVVFGVFGISYLQRNRKIQGGRA